MTTWLSTDDAAGDLGFTSKTIRAWCVQGKFPGARKFPDDKPRSEWRIPEEDVKALKDRRAVESGPSLDRKRRNELLAKLAA